VQIFSQYNFKITLAGDKKGYKLQYRQSVNASWLWRLRHNLLAEASHAGTAESELLIIRSAGAAIQIKGIFYANVQKIIKSAMPGKTVIIAVDTLSDRIIKST